MGCILIGIAAAIVVTTIIWIIVYVCETKDPVLLIKLSLYLSLAFVLIGIWYGVIQPISGYEEPEIVANKEQLKEVDSEYKIEFSKSYVDEVYSQSKVIVIEDDNCTEPKLVIYRIRPKMTFWTFAIGAADKYEYVFYVPTGTIAKE